MSNKLNEIIYAVIGGHLTKSEALAKADAIANRYAQRGWLSGKNEECYEKACEDIAFFAVA